MHSFRFHSISDTLAIRTISSRHTERKMYLKLTMLFLLIGFVVGLPYPFEYGQFGKRRPATLRRADLAASIANHESAERGSIDELRQSFL
jgi:hypothetical protein